MGLLVAFCVASVRCVWLSRLPCAVESFMLWVVLRRVHNGVEVGGGGLWAVVRLWGV